MATSAQTLSLIIDELVKAKPLDRDAAITLLSAKGMLPKKLTETPKAKKVSIYASKAAEDFAEAKGSGKPKGTAANKISVKDLAAEGPKSEGERFPEAQQPAGRAGHSPSRAPSGGEVSSDVKPLWLPTKDLPPV